MATTTNQLNKQKPTTKKQAFSVNFFSFLFFFFHLFLLGILWNEFIFLKGKIFPLPVTQIIYPYQVRFITLS